MSYHTLRLLQPPSCGIFHLVCSLHQDPFRLEPSCLCRLRPRPQGEMPPKHASDGRSSKLHSPSELSFSTICSFLGVLEKHKGHKKRREQVERFIDRCILKNSRDAYSVFRLILPGLDLGRGNYKLLELKLAQVLLKACNLNKDDPKAKAVKAWRKPKTGAAGDFAKVMEQILFRDYCMKSENTEGAKELKVGQLNAMLDDLVQKAGKTDEQAQILQNLINMTTPQQMKWLTQIILKNMRIGVSEKTIFDAWHPSAQEFYNNSGMKLDEVFNKLIDSGTPIMTSIVPGRMVRPQLAAPTLSPEAAFEKMHSKDGSQLRPFVIETKFDGERIQVHCDGEKCYYFSRQAIDHGPHSGYAVLDELFQKQVKHKRYILDGELVAWNKTREHFEPFGGLKSVVKAVREKKGPHEVVDADSEETAYVRDMDLLYVAFDVLYIEDKVVTDLPLRRRHELLREAFKEGTASTCVPLEGSVICGRIVPMIPEETTFNGVLASREGHSMEDIKEALDTVTALREEGIVIKALDSPWIPDSRQSNWLKIKPEYIHSPDIDCLIIGVWWGEGRRGGEVPSKYLLALRDTGPCPWISFARVGSGLSDEERKSMFQKLKDNLTEGKQPPCYKTTGREKPDQWVVNPDQSVVVAIRADLRIIKTKEYATGYSVRFPRIETVRYDKDPIDANTVKELDNIVQEGASLLKKSMETERESAGGRGKGKRKGRSGAKGPKAKKQRRVVSNALLTEPSSVKRVSKIFRGMSIKFADYGDLGKEVAERIVLRHGGEVVLSHPCTHVFAGCSEKKGWKVQGLEKEGCDIFCTTWLAECDAALKRLPLKPRHYVHLSKKTLQSSKEWDRYGDPYLVDVEGVDMERLLHGTMAGFNFDASTVSELGLEEEEEEGGEGGSGLAGAAKPRSSLGGRRRSRHGSGRSAPTVQDLLRHLDMQLAGIGALDPRTSLLREVTLVLLDVGRPGAGEPGATAEGAQGGSSGGGGDSAGALLFPDVAKLWGVARQLEMEIGSMRARQLKASAQLHGAQLSASVHPGVSHIVCLVSDEEPAITPATLLEAVSKHAGGRDGVLALKQGLLEGTMQLVTAGWLDETFEVLAEDPSTAQCASEADHLLNLEEAGHMSSWPWGKFAAPSPAAEPTAWVGGGGTSVLLGKRAAAGAARMAGSRKGVKVRGKRGSPPAVKLEPMPGVKAEPRDEPQAGPARTGRRGRLTKPKLAVKEEPGTGEPGRAWHGVAAPATTPAQEPLLGQAQGPVLSMASLEPAPAPSAPGPTASIPLPAQPLAAGPAAQTALQAAALGSLDMFDMLFGGGSTVAPTTAAAIADPVATVPAAAAPTYFVPNQATGPAKTTDSMPASVPVPDPAANIAGPDTGAEGVLKVNSGEGAALRGGLRARMAMRRQQQQDPSGAID